MRDTIKGKDLGRAVIGNGTLLSSLVQGKTLGTGKFRITDATGAVSTITVDPTILRTVGDLVTQINAASTAVKASINDTGDGILLKDSAASGTGQTAIKVEDARR